MRNYNTKYIWMYTTQYFLPLLVQNPHFSDIKRYFPKENYFYMLYNAFFQPTKEIRNTIEKYKVELLDRSKYDYIFGKFVHSTAQS